MESKLRTYIATGLTMIVLLLAIPLILEAAEPQENVAFETGFYYTVQKGDTLRDLSKKFSDTPWVWPEMWKENDQIANPHRIYPGERIRLYRKRLTQGAGTGTGGETGAGTQTGMQDKPELTSLLGYAYGAIERVGFIRREAVMPHGTIFKVEGQKEMISPQDLVYIQPRENFALMPGNKYTTYRTLQPIVDQKTGKFIGIQHYLTGVVEIIIKRPEFVVGRIIAGYRPIKVGDMLMPYVERMKTVDMHPTPPGIEGNIILAEEHQSIFGETTVAFIDKGKSDGVEPGQFYWIFKQEKYLLNPKDDNAVTLTPVLLGELLVLRTENTTATVMITDSRRAITAGERIISPFKLE